MKTAKYLVLAARLEAGAKAPTVEREEFPGPASAFTEARRLRAAGYKVTVLEALK